MRVNVDDFKMSNAVKSSGEEKAFFDYNATKLDESKRSEACCYKDNTGYYVKVNTRKGLYDERDDEYIKLSSKSAKATIHNMFTFLQVQGAIYTAYLSYLRTKNQMFLRAAQRDIDMGSSTVRAPLVIQASQETSTQNDTTMKPLT